MKLRKLEQSENKNTRKLWETVFFEDSKEFLDYYYYFKTKDNEIFVIEEEGGIRSMLQLNPYTLQIEEDSRSCRYIIGVATEKEYRKRGYMGALLRRAMQEMYDRKEPFTFLMPAAESIYTPYDFRFVYDQCQTEEWGVDKRRFLQLNAAYSCAADGSLQNICLQEGAGETPPLCFGEAASWRQTCKTARFQDASMGDAQEIAEFVQQYFSGKWQVYAARNEEYYHTLIFEQQSEHGGIRLMRAEGKLAGFFLYADEDGLEIREPLYLPEYEAAFSEAVLSLMDGRGDRVKLFAWEKGTKKVPLIMARILHLESMLSCMKVREGREMDCSFAVLDSILPQNSRIWRIRGGEETGWKVRVRETEDSEGVLTIGALTGLLFGYRTVEEASQEEDVIMTAHLKAEMEKLQVLRNVWLNEIV